MAERQLPADPGDDVPGLTERNEAQRPDGGGDDVVVDERNERQGSDDGNGQKIPGGRTRRRASPHRGGRGGPSHRHGRFHRYSDLTPKNPVGLNAMKSSSST